MATDADTRALYKQEFAVYLDTERVTRDVADLAKAAEDGSPPRLAVDVIDLLKHNPELHSKLLNRPSECLPPFQEALEELLRSQFPKALQTETEVQISLVGEFGAHRLSPRQLLAALQGKLVCVEGIVTKASIVRPKWVRSVHYCAATGKEMTREYRDVTSLNGAPTGSNFPQRDDEGNLLETQYGRSTFRNQQHLTIQELPETAPPGQLPRSCDVILENDLVDAAKPGDRVAIVGIFKAIPPRAAGTMSGNFRAVLVANHVRQLSQDASLTSYTSDDVKNIRKLGASADVLQQLAFSLAPSIYGHEMIKQALVLLLLGGRERNLPNGGHLRGDINCLMVGDPGVAKSQLLRAMINVAPLAVSTTGRGSSGVGLTAAVTNDSDTGERRLEAGAMVLADRGLVCIDEFDKMNDADRVAIHEVMEQQTVTIAKAGIHCSLNARCSVVAAANPLYGNYDHSLSVTRNVNLPDSLLSRFDLLFIVLDNMDANSDRKVADHVIGQHQYKGGSGDGHALTDEQAWRRESEGVEGQSTQMRVKYNRMLHGARAAGAPEPLTTAFLKKYIKFAKSRYKEAELTPEAMADIGDYYAELRGSSDIRALPVTVRTLETIIRLSTAAAKVRLSAEVESRDVDVAKSLLDVILKNDSGEGKRPAAANLPVKRGRRDDGGSSDDSDDDDEAGPSGEREADGATPPDVDMADAQLTQQDRASRRASRGAAGPSTDAAAPSDGSITAGQVNSVAIVLREMFVDNTSGAQRFTFSAVLKRCEKLRLARDQVDEALKQLHTQSAESEAAPVGMIYKAGYIYDTS